MKPRTKLQKRVVDLSKQLPKIETEMTNWAKKDLLVKKGFATKNKVECLECGNSFSPSIVKRKAAICPHCNTKLKVEVTRRRTDKIQLYLASADAGYYDFSSNQEFQLVRYFELNVTYSVGYKPKYSIREVLQHWILPDGKITKIGRLLQNWTNTFSGSMEIRKDGTYKKYDVYVDRFHPHSVFKAEYRKYGINHNLQGLTFLDAIKIVPHNPKAETLLKAKRYDLLGCFTSYNHSHAIYAHWASIKICLRNKYKIPDVKIWFDYLELLQNFNKDLNNAHYVCPKDLRKEHDALVVKKRKQIALLAEKRKRREAIENEELFLKLKSKFFGIAFSNKTIEVHVLESIQAVMEEGDILHHCVFTNGYYKREDSLILSATVNGKKTETVEVSLSKMEVVQCRGLQNKNSEYHEAIIKLVNQNMGIIWARMQKKKKSSVKRMKMIA